jgi:hypothetical protein
MVSSRKSGHIERAERGKCCVLSQVVEHSQPKTDAAPRNRRVPLATTASTISSGRRSSRCEISRVLGVTVDLSTQTAPAAGQRLGVSCEKALLRHVTTAISGRRELTLFPKSARSAAPLHRFVRRQLVEREDARLRCTRLSMTALGSPAHLRACRRGAFEWPLAFVLRPPISSYRLPHSQASPARKRISCSESFR